MDYALKTGDKVEILTAKRGGPSRDWLNPNLGLVKTQRAKAKIKSWFKREAIDHNISQGKAMLERELHRLGLENVNNEQLARQYEYKTTDDFFVAIGMGDLTLSRIVTQLMLEEEDEEGFKFTTRPKTEPGQQSHDTITVLGLKGLLTTMGRCCNPVPGDEIIGYITRGRGATIHRVDCPNMLRIRERERLVRVSWGEPKRTYPVSVQIKAFDRDGLMKDISTLISDEGINMGQVKAGVNQNIAVVDMILEVREVDQLTRVLTRLEALPNVLQVHRHRPG